MNTPNDCPDAVLHEIYEGGIDVPARPLTNPETLLGNRPRSLFSPSKPEGTPIYFADEIPIAWLLQKLAEAGLITTRWVSDGYLHSVLTVDARAQIAREIDDARLRAVQSARLES